MDNETIPNIKLNKWYESLVRINGQEISKKLIEKIISGDLLVFNENLIQMGYKPDEKRTKLTLKKLITEIEVINDEHRKKNK